MKILNLWSLAGLGAAQRIDSLYSDERNDLPGPFGRLSTRQVPCQWAGWCDWTQCGATCGPEATKSRSRECACGPDIDPTSRGCVGDDHQVEPCGQEECPEALPEECWTQWSEWGECCDACNGERTRSRSCTCGSPGCTECPGDNIESEPCNESKCSVGDWNLWSDCSVSCGKGQRQRQRDCVCAEGQSPEDCGGCGDEALEDWQPCMDQECAPKCNPGSWEPWSPCSTTCGNDGERTRSRPCGSTCDSNNPEEKPEETGPCDPSDCAPCEPPPCDCEVPECDQPDRCKEECKPAEPECKWSNWSPFCSCSSSCDEGIQRRTRNCYCGPDFDEPETDLPRPGCEGDSVEEEPCNNGPCEQCEPGDWAPWSECDCDTEPPVKTRERDCDCGPEICDDSCNNQKQTCSLEECPLPPPKECKGPWNEWGPCDAVCGTGTRSRDRECLCGAPGCPGCDENMSEEEECEGDDSLKCSAGEWSDFSPCDAECDQTGQMFRNRECVCPPGLPEPTPEDCDCPEDLEECKTCYGEKCSCPGDWEEWGPCDGPCNSGYRERIKKDPCLTDVDGNPAPPEVQTESCGEPEVCEAGEWGEWSECDAECDQFGQMFRYRPCDCPDGVSEEDEECGCDGSECETCKGPPCSCLGEWSEWGPCDGECGGGIKTRERNDPCVPDFVPEIEEELCEEKREFPAVKINPKILHEQKADVQKTISSILSKYL